MSDAELRAALRDLQVAVQDEGPAPRYHRDILARHRHEWPTLWHAIDRILAAMDD